MIELICTPYPEFSIKSRVNSSYYDVLHNGEVFGTVVDKYSARQVIFYRTDKKRILVEDDFVLKEE